MSDWADEEARELSNRKLKSISIKDCVEEAIQNTATALRAAERRGREAFTSGTEAVIPQTREHAEALYTVAVACLKGLGSDPEADIERRGRVNELHHAAAKALSYAERELYDELLARANAIEAGE
jgi:hypothetical protein